MIEMQEFSIRIGEGGQYAATLTCLPMESDQDLVWQGSIKFDNDILNFPVIFPHYDGIGSSTMYNEWVYHRQTSGGTHLMNLLEGWWEDVTALFERVKSLGT